MIKRLTRRMILLVLCGLLLASAGLVFAINYMNWKSLTTQASDVLSLLAESGGQRPARWDFAPEELPERTEGRGGNANQDNRSPGERPTETPPPALNGQTPSANFQNDFFRRIRGERSGETELQNAVSLTNFYTVYLAKDGAVESWSSDRTDLYTDEEVAALAADVLQRGEKEGRVDTQFYRLTEMETGWQLIVVDQRLEVQNAWEVLRLTVLVALVEDALLSLGAIWLIRRMVQPVEEAMEKQKQFVWDASHELKTPLAVISANAEVLSAEVGDVKPLAYIQSEVRRTDQLIQNLLTLARMEKGTADTSLRPFDLSRALLEVALPFESAVFEAGKTMDMEIPDGIRYTGNEDMIKQLTVILLSNAEKYSNAGGSIRVSLEEKGDKRVLRVHNTGPAIPPEAQEKIFDRFYRVDSSHNREVEGNGLGLAIARSIVETHHGRIAVRSSEGEGTTFTVTL